MQGAGVWREGSHTGGGGWQIESMTQKFNRGGEKKEDRVVV